MTAMDIAKMDQYKKLVRTRTRYGWFMTSLMLVVYFGYIYLVAYRQDFLAQTFPNSVIGYSIPIGIGVILFTIILTGIYVRRANNEFDRLIQEIKAGAQS